MLAKANLQGAYKAAPPSHSLSTSAAALILGVSAPGALMNNLLIPKASFV